MQFNSSSTGGSIESLPDARDQAKEAKSQEAPRGDSQASEEAEEAKRKDGQCERSEKRIPLTFFSANFSGDSFRILGRCYLAPSVKAITCVGLFGAALPVAWGFWIDRHRESIRL